MQATRWIQAVNLPSTHPCIGLTPQSRCHWRVWLSFNRNYSPPDAQRRVFITQLELAANVQKPVFLHERDAFESQLSLLRRYRDRLIGGVVHCFTGNTEQLLAYNQTWIIHWHYWLAMRSQARSSPTRSGAIPAVKSLTAGNRRPLLTAKDLSIWQ